MEDVGPTANMVLFIVLVLIDMFFYGFGSAITFLNLKEIVKKAEEDKDKKSLRLSRIIVNPAEYINTVQLIVTLINMVMGAFYLSIWMRHVQRAITDLAEKNFGGRITLDVTVAGSVSTAVTMLFLLYVILTFGVLLPKKLAARQPEKWAYACINPVYYITVILLPLTRLVSLSVRLIMGLFGMKNDKDTGDVTEAEIISMVNEGHEQGLIQASEAEMITNIFEYGDKEAQDIMTHRNNIVAIDGEMTLREAIDFMLAEQNSRFPVYEENIDHIIGILHLKDALRVNSKSGRLGSRQVKEIKGLNRNVKFIPQTRNIDELFKQMQSEKLQMVIVVDEYGQTDGLIAMEDILEEIVGNIMDEYDEDSDYIRDDGNDGYTIAGITPLEELEEKLGISFEEEEFETLNGFLISKLDRIPDKDEEFDIDVEGYNFKILSVENNMIQTVQVTKPAERIMEGQEQSPLEET